MELVALRLVAVVPCRAMANKSKPEQDQPVEEAPAPSKKEGPSPDGGSWADYLNRGQ